MDKPRIGQKYVAAIRDEFGLAVQEESWQAPDQVTITVDLNTLPALVESLYYRHGCWLSVVAANDERPLNGHFALYYVLSVEGNEQEKAEACGYCYMVVRALVPPLDPEFPAVSPLVPAAIWYEREIRDLFGIRPVGMLDERRLVLPDDWPADLYPLRKDTMDDLEKCVYIHDQYEIPFNLLGESNETSFISEGSLTTMIFTLGRENGDKLAHFGWTGPSEWEFGRKSDGSLDFVNSTGYWSWVSDPTPINVQLKRPDKTINFGVELPEFNDSSANKYFIFNQMQNSSEDWVSSGYILQ